MIPPSAFRFSLERCRPCERPVGPCLGAGEGLCESITLFKEIECGQFVRCDLLSVQVCRGEISCASKGAHRLSPCDTLTAAHLCPRLSSRFLHGQPLRVGLFCLHAFPLAVLTLLLSRHPFVSASSLSPPSSATTMCAFITPCVSFGAAAPAARLAAASRRHQAAAAAGGRSRWAARPSPPPPLVMETVSFEKIEDVLDTPTSKIAKYALTLRVDGSTSSLVRKETVASAKKTIKAPGFRPGTIPPFMRASIQEFILTECLQVRCLFGEGGGEGKRERGRRADPCVQALAAKDSREDLVARGGMGPMRRCGDGASFDCSGIMTSAGLWWGLSLNGSHCSAAIGGGGLWPNQS